MPELDEQANGSPPEQAAEAAVAQGHIDVRSAALTVIAIAVTIVLLRYMQEVFVPLAIGTLLFYALDPMVDSMERGRVPRPIGATLALVLVLASLAGLTYALQGQAREVANGLPEGARRFRAMIQAPSSSQSALQKVDEAAKELQKDAPQDRSSTMKVEVQEPPFKASQYLWSGSTTAATSMNQMVMILFLTYFLLVADDLFKRKLVEIVAPR